MQFAGKVEYVYVRVKEFSRPSIEVLFLTQLNISSFNEIDILFCNKFSLIKDLLL